MSIDWGSIAAAISPKKGEPKDFRYQGAGPYTTYGVSLGQWNGCNVVVIPPSGTNISADIHIQGNYVPGGFSDVADPNGIVIGATSAKNIDVVVGSLWVAVNLSNMAGTPDPGQSWVITITPCNLPGTRNRSNYYDRNPSNRSASYGIAGQAPHNVTTRLSYTVPTGRKAFIDNIALWAERDTAAGTVKESGGDTYYTPSGGSAANIAFTFLYDNTVGAFDRNVINQAGVMLPGDQIIIDDYDDSTGGTCDFFGSFKIFEFDY